MWGLDTIKEAGEAAREKGAEPLLLAADEYVGLSTVSNAGGFPNLGDYANEVDDEHKRIATLFCDSSGFGLPSEPALTQEQLVRKVKELLDEHDELLFGIVEVGQFQLHLGVWEP
jgi:hypothetical protein